MKPDWPLPPQVVPSLLAADFARLADEIRSVEAAGVRVLHLDVMDGHFVPEITFGQPIMRKMRSASRCLFDTHLMIRRPLDSLESFADAGADLVTVHLEALIDENAGGRGAPPARSPIGSGDPVLGRIREARRILAAKGCKLGLSFRPVTDPLPWLREAGDLLDLVMLMTVEPGFGGQGFMADQLPKISAVRSMRTELGCRFLVEIDGGVGPENAAACVGAGAEYLVAGTAVFGRPDRSEAIASILGATQSRT